MNLKFDPLLIVSLLIIWLPLIYVMLTRLHKNRKQRALMQVFEKSSLHQTDEIKFDDGEHLNTTESPQNPISDYNLDHPDDRNDTLGSVRTEGDADYAQEIGGKPDSEPERRTGIRRESEREAFTLSQKLLEMASSKSSEYDDDPDVQHNAQWQDTLDGASDVNREHLILDLLGRLKKQELINNEMRIRLRQFEISGTNGAKNMLFSTKISQLTETLKERDTEISQLKYHLNHPTTDINKLDGSASPALTRQMEILIEKLQSQQTRIAELESLLDSASVEADELASGSRYESSSDSTSLSNDLELALTKLRQCRESLTAYKESEQILIEENTRLRTVGENLEALEQRLSDEQAESESLRTSLNEFIAMKESLSQTQVILENTQLHLDQSTEKISTLEYQLVQEQQRIDKLDADLETAHQSNANLELKLTESRQHLELKNAEFERFKDASVDSVELDNAHKRASELGLELETVHATLLLAQQRLESTELARTDQANELSELQKQSNELENKLSDLHAEKTNSANEIKTLREKLTQKAESLNALSHKVDEKNKAHDGAQEHVNALKSENAELKRRLADALQELEREQQQVESSRQRRQSNTDNVVSIATAVTTMQPRQVKDPDDLQQIRGIGPKIEQILIENGYTSFDQLADLKKKDIEYLKDKLGQFKGRIERDNWKASAKALVKKRKFRVA